MKTTTITTTKKTDLNDLDYTFAVMSNAHTRMCKENAEMQMRNEEAYKYMRGKEIEETLGMTLAGLCVVATPIALCIIGAMF